MRPQWILISLCGVLTCCVSTGPQTATGGATETADWNTAMSIVHRDLITIQRAVEHWALVKRKPSHTSTPSWSDLAEFIEGAPVKLPLNPPIPGRYVINPVGEETTFVLSANDMSLFVRFPERFPFVAVATNKSRITGGTERR